MTAIQLDLFGEVLAAEQHARTADLQRRIDGLTCLRDNVPDAMEAVLLLGYHHSHDNRSVCFGGDWAYLLCQAGLRFESGTTWKGWDHQPAHLLTWNELTTLIGADPRRTELAAWADTVPQPRWRHTHRPFEFWPHPEQWHPGYIQKDHADPQWPAREHAWNLLQQLLTDTITSLTATTPPGVLG